VSASTAALISPLGTATIENKQKLPIVPKRLEKALRRRTRSPMICRPPPTSFGWNDGSVISEIQTESIHGSGITYGNGALWIASTWGLKTLKVDPRPERRWHSSMSRAR
jgi:hypothetical protein